jgi:hypothetical protein
VIPRKWWRGSRSFIANSLKGGDRALKESGTGHSKHDVIDIDEEVDGVVVVPMDE